mgnify:CR=1 FL=1
MSKRDDLIQKYAADLKEKCDVEADMELLTRVVIACGPSIYNADSSTVSSSSTDELKTVQHNWVMKKLGVTDEDSAMGAVQEAVRIYGHSNRNKYRAVLYYLIATNLNAGDKV